MSRVRDETVLSAVLVLVFAATGAVKLLFPETAAGEFRGWGYPGWFAWVIGVAELAGAAGVLAGCRIEVGGVPLRRVAAAMLGTIMVGAAATHVRHAEWGMLTVATGLLVAAAGLVHRMRTGDRPGP